VEILPAESPWQCYLGLCSDCHVVVEQESNPKPATVAGASIAVRLQHSLERRTQKQKEQARLADIVGDFQASFDYHSSCIASNTLLLKRRLEVGLGSGEAAKVFAAIGAAERMLDGADQALKDLVGSIGDRVARREETKRVDHRAASGADAHFPRLLLQRSPSSGDAATVDLTGSDDEDHEMAVASSSAAFSAAPTLAGAASKGKAAKGGATSSRKRSRASSWFDESSIASKRARLAPRSGPDVQEGDLVALAAPVEGAVTSISDPLEVLGVAESQML
jgi:hypothetical protein